MSDTTLVFTFLGDGETEGPDNNFEPVVAAVANFEKEVFAFNGVAIGSGLAEAKVEGATAEGDGDYCDENLESSFATTELPYSSSPYTFSLRKSSATCFGSNKLVAFSISSFIHSFNDGKTC